MYGVIIIAHGSRASNANDIISKIAKKVKNSLQDAEVEYGFLRKNSDDFDEIFNKFDSLGIDEIVVVPYFLFDGGHVKETIPSIVKGFSDKHPNKKIIIKESLGDDERLAEIVIDRVLL